MVEAIHYQSKQAKYGSFAGQYRAVDAYPGLADNQYANPAPNHRSGPGHQATGDAVIPVVFVPALLRNRFRGQETVENRPGCAT